MRDKPRLENATRTRLSQISGTWRSQKLSSNSLNYSDGRGTSGHSSGLSDTELTGARGSSSVGPKGAQDRSGRLPEPATPSVCMTDAHHCPPLPAFLPHCESRSSHSICPSRGPLGVSGHGDIFFTNWKKQTLLKMRRSSEDCCKNRSSVRPGQSPMSLEPYTPPCPDPARCVSFCRVLGFSDQDVPAVFPAQGLEFTG